MDVATAQALLRQFDCTRTPEPVSEVEGDRLRDALHCVAQHSDYQMLGVCADSWAQGVAALQQYAEALGYQLEQTGQPMDGSVYLKFNSLSGRCYADTYSGTHRGVLVSCQSSEAEGVNDLFGHLPLDLFSP